MTERSNDQLEDLNAIPGDGSGPYELSTGRVRNEGIFLRNTRRRIGDVEVVRTSISHVQTPESTSLMHPPNSSQSVQPFSWNWTTRLPSNGASALSDPVHFHEGESSHQAEIRGNLVQNPTNASSLNGIANFVRNIASNSESFQSHSWSLPALNLAEQYNQRLSEIYHSSIANSAGMQSNYPPPNPSTESIGVQATYYPLNPGAVAHGGQTSYGPLHPDAAAAVRTLPPVPHYTPVFVPIPMRPPNALPHPVQTLTGDQVRSRLAAEIAESAATVGTLPHVPQYAPVFVPIPMGPLHALPHSVQPFSSDQVHQALGIVHNGNVMIFNNSIVYGDPDWDSGEEEGPDAHEHMRLDVDNMSYEELLALEEHIGNVNTGVTEENILEYLRRQIYKPFKLFEIPVGEEPCCICREDYVDGEEIGKLDCGHDFHFNCIKQWLLLKNICPICKLTALGS